MLEDGEEAAVGKAVRGWRADLGGEDDFGFECVADSVEEVSKWGIEGGFGGGGSGRFERAQGSDVGEDDVFGVARHDSTDDCTRGCEVGGG